MAQTRKPTPDVQIIGIRLPKDVAIAIKQEAARRNIRLNKLVLEMWGQYQQGQKGK